MVFLLLVHLGLLLAEPNTHEALVIQVGKTTSLTVDPEKDIRVANGQVIRVLEDGSTTLHIHGAEVGSTDLAVGSKSWRVHVVSSATLDFYHQLPPLLLNMTGPKLKLDQGQVQIHGELIRTYDYQRIQRLALEHQATFTLHAKLWPGVRKFITHEITSLSQKRRWPKPTFKENPMRALFPKKMQVQPADLEAELGPRGIMAVYDENQVEFLPLVRAHVILAEVSKNFDRTLGVKWPSAYEGQILPVTQMKQPLLVQLQAMESGGLGQILASPRLLVRSGSQAEFLAGGEIPIRISGYRTKEVVWKQHGVVLKLQPHADDSGHISLKLETEISLLDAGNSVDGIPALKTHRVQSHFDLQSGATVALSGLMRQDWGKTREGLPALRRLPVLGLLFSSQSYLDHKSEFVVFVTPEVVRPDQLNDTFSLPERHRDNSTPP